LVTGQCIATKTLSRQLVLAKEFSDVDALAVRDLLAHPIPSSRLRGHASGREARIQSCESVTFSYKLICTRGRVLGESWWHQVVGRELFAPEAFAVVRRGMECLGCD
jgi:hypothetical protein